MPFKSLSLDEKKQAEVIGMLRLQIPMSEVAVILGCTEGSLRWYLSRRANKSFSEKCKQAAAVGNLAVRNEWYKQCQDGNMSAISKWLSTFDKDVIERQKAAESDKSNGEDIARLSEEEINAIIFGGVDEGLLPTITKASGATRAANIKVLETNLEDVSQEPAQVDREAGGGPEKEPA